MVDGSKRLTFCAMTIVMCLVFCSGCGSDDGSSKADQVKKSIEEMFDISKKGHFKDLAVYLAYRGSDSSRKWKDHCNADNQDELAYLESAGKRIAGYLSASDRYEFEEFQVESESEGEWCIWKVVFIKGEEKKTALFACLKIKEKYALGDID